MSSIYTFKIQQLYDMLKNKNSKYRINLIGFGAVAYSFHRQLFEQFDDYIGIEEINIWSRIKTEIKDGKIVYIPWEETNSKNNDNEPYHFKQSFGTDIDYEPQIDIENPNVINLDKKFDFLQQVKCDSMNNQFTLYFNIKFPYVYSNKYWKTSFRKMKPILRWQF